MEDNKNENITPETPAPETSVPEVVPGVVPTFDCAPAGDPAPGCAPVPETVPETVPEVAPMPENPFSAGQAPTAPMASDRASASFAADDSVPEPTAAAQNPFAALSAPTPAPAAPANPVGPAPYAQQPAPAPYEPYAVAQPFPASDSASSYNAYGAAGSVPPQGAAPQPGAAYPASGQPFYSASGSYGAQQPPTPPVPPAPVYGYEPPAAGGQKRRWPWFLLGLAVGLVIGLGGCVSCAGIMAAATFDDSYSDDYLYDYDYDYDDSTWPLEDDADVLGGSDGLSDRLSYDEVADILEGEGLASGIPDTEGACSEGYYTVGPEGDIPAGLYYLQGSGDALSFYYLFDGDSDGYELDDGVRYYGNYFAQLDEGDLIAFMPGSDGLTMYPAPATSTNPVAPYNNGCYRVGIDIPAGSYTVTALPVPEGDDSGESAAFVMKDLEFNDDSVVDTQYVIAGGKQVVTVTDGQYLELYAAAATPVAQG